VAREDLLTRTFVDLADIGISKVDPIKLGQLVVERCVELFDASAAGIVVGDSTDHLRVVASSSNRTHEVELFELRSGQGPSIESYRTGSLVSEPDLTHTRRWPRFGPVALAAGYRSVQAVPIYIPGQTIGALNLFRNETGALPQADTRAAQALAQAAAVTILRRRIESGTSADRPPPVPTAEQIIMEQAKGMVAGLAAITVDEASVRIHRYAQHHNLSAAGVCHDIVSGTLKLVTFQERSHRKWAGSRP
jgi:hypothetical protein